TRFGSVISGTDFSLFHLRMTRPIVQPFDKYISISAIPLWNRLKSVPHIVFAAGEIRKLSTRSSKSSEGLRGCPKVQYGKRKRPEPREDGHFREVQGAPRFPYCTFGPSEDLLRAVLSFRSTTSFCPHPIFPKYAEIRQLPKSGTR